MRQPFIPRAGFVAAALLVAALARPGTVQADPSAAIIIGYADGSAPGVGVGPIYRVPDTFGGPEPYFIRYPAPPANGPGVSSQALLTTDTIHGADPAKASEPFLPAGPQPLFANGGPCSQFNWDKHHSWSVVGIDTGSTAYREGALYVVSMPDKADTNNWRTCTTIPGASGFNTFWVSLQNSNWSGAIAQIGVVRGWIGDYDSGTNVYKDNPTFRYTPYPNNGETRDWTLVSLVYNHNYYFRVDNFNSGVYNYWEYCGNDLTAATGTKCLAQINSTSMRSGAGPNAYWAGSEAADTNDTMGGYANADYLFYAFHATTTAGIGSYPNLSCKVFRENNPPPSYYHCTDGTWNGRDDFYPWTY